MADPRHKRESAATRPLGVPRGRLGWAALVAVAVTSVALALGLGRPLLGAAVRPASQGVRSRQPGALPAPARARAVPPVSRSFDRRTVDALAGASPRAYAVDRATARAVLAAHLRRWTTTDLNLWSGSAATALRLGTLSAGTRVLVTGRAAGGRVEVVVGGAPRWVTAGYLTATRAGVPGSAAPVSAGLSMAPCPDDSMEYRLTPGAVLVHRSVCHAFPQVTTYLGWAPRGEHASGKAIDIMTSDVALGTRIAEYLQAHAAQLHLYDVIWRQHIWTPVRAAEGWRLMPDRGSPTANHMNHVHVSVS